MIIFYKVVPHHNEMFGTNISQIAILMVDRDGKVKDFVIEGPEYEKYCEMYRKTSNLLSLNNLKNDYSFLRIISMATANNNVVISNS